MLHRSPARKRAQFPNRHERNNVTASERCSHIHLPRSSARRLRNLISKSACHLETPIIAVSIDDNNLRCRREFAHVLEKLPQRRSLVQHRHDDGKAHCFLALQICGQDNQRAMSRKIHAQIVLAVVLIAFHPPGLAANNVPSGIKHDGYDRLLKKYVNSQGLVAYEKWKGNAEDMKALEERTRGVNRFAVSARNFGFCKIL